MREREQVSRFEATVLPHLDAAYTLARWLTRNPADADDVVQEAFLRAFRFELREIDHIHFAPTGTYKHRDVNDAEIFEKIEGDLWFDLQTHEISRLEFELKEDIGNFIGKLYKGSQFSIDLKKAIDNRYLPSVWSVRMNQRMLTSKGAEETEVRYFNYRKFGSTVTLVFGDVEVPGQ